MRGEGDGDVGSLEPCEHARVCTADFTAQGDAACVFRAVDDVVNGDWRRQRHAHAADGEVPAGGVGDATVGIACQVEECAAVDLHEIAIVSGQCDTGGDGHAAAADRDTCAGHIDGGHQRAAGFFVDADVARSLDDRRVEGERERAGRRNAGGFVNW